MSSRRSNCRTILFAFFLFLLHAAPASAQNPAPRLELFGGFTWIRGGISPTLAQYGLAHVNGYGFDGSATENVNRWFGATIDVSGAYARPAIIIPANAFGPGDPAMKTTFTNEVNGTAYTAMFGPSFAYRRLSRVSLFARVLLGDVNARASTTSKGALALGMAEKVSKNRFGFAAGGGADIQISRNLAARVTADLIHSSFADFVSDRQNSLRVSAGLVYQIGSR